MFPGLNRPMPRPAKSTHQPPSGKVEIKPQPGPQVHFLASQADIAIYGGAAGGGKTWSLLIEPTRHIANPKFSCVTFRRTFPMITSEGGLWDESGLIYSALGAQPRVSNLEWLFESGATARFSHLQHEQNIYDWQGSQIPLICFDELTHFSEKQFFYLLSRNRSMCGVKPYVRATTNPDATSWVKKLCAPWVDSHFDGYLGKAKSAELRYFIRQAGEIVWCPKGTPRAKSITFVFASVYDNKKLLEVNPEYLDNLHALPFVEQERLLRGNWDITESGNMFKAEWLVPIVEIPSFFKRLVRFWDLAGTKKDAKDDKKNDPDYTAGALVGQGYDGVFYFLDLILERETPGEIEKLIQRTAESDTERYGRVEIIIEQEPGSSGQYLVDNYRNVVLKGFPCTGYRSTGNKVDRAKPASSATQFGSLKMVLAKWNADFLAMATAFPRKDVHDDPVDALSGAYSVLTAPPDKLIYKPTIISVRSGWTQ